MKKPQDLYPLWSAAKRAVTKNFWLKIISLVLALATYTALEPKTETRSAPNDAAADDKRRLSNILKIIERDEKNRPEPPAESTNAVSSASTKLKKK